MYTLGWGHPIVQARINADPRLMALRLSLGLFISQLYYLHSLVDSLSMEGMLGPDRSRPQDEYSLWSPKGKFSVNVPSPQKNFAWPFGSGAQSGPITVSREVRFSDWHLTPPLWWDSILDGHPHQNHKEEKWAVPMRKELGTDKLKNDQYWLPCYYCIPLFSPSKFIIHTK